VKYINQEPDIVTSTSLLLYREGQIGVERQTNVHMRRTDW